MFRENAEVCSRLDPKVSLDAEHWAVTLIRLGANHAAIVVEGTGSCVYDFRPNRSIHAYYKNYERDRHCCSWFLTFLSSFWALTDDSAKKYMKCNDFNLSPDANYWGQFNGKYWAVSMHLTSIKAKTSRNEKTEGLILLDNLTDRDIKYKMKGPTFYIHKNKVRRMLKVIESEKKNPPKFHPFGDESIIAQQPEDYIIQKRRRQFTENIDEYAKLNVSEGQVMILRSLAGLNKVTSDVHNCISWAREKLRFIGIKLEVHGSDIIFTTTTQYTDGYKSFSL